ncbi:hypothetical protein D3C72_1433150 [compost metagenome]
MRSQRGHRADRPRHIARDHVLRHGRLALVGDVRHVEVAGLVQVRADQVREGADAIGAVADLALVLRGPVEELLHVLYRHVPVHGQHDLGDAEFGDKGQVPAHVIRHVAVQVRRVDQRRGVGEQDGVAVRRAARDGLHRDHARAAGLVVDDDGLPETLAHVLGQCARHGVGGAAGRARDNNGDGTRRVALGTAGGAPRHRCHRDQGLHAHDVIPREGG